MAKLHVVTSYTTTSKIRVRITELDTSWASGERYAHFYISDSGYSTSSSYYDGMLTLDEGIEESKNYTFTGLDSDTKYYISCVIKRGDTGNTIVTLTASEWTDEETLDLPYFSITPVTDTTAYINISNLGNPFNSSYYKSVGVTTGAFTSQGTTTIPATVKGTKSATSSGSSTSTGFQVTGLSPGTTYKFYCFAQAANGKYYAISKYRTSESYGISFTTDDATRPDDWKWISTIAQDEPIQITAAEWINFCDRINEFREYVGLSDYSFTVPVAGTTKISATIVNQARTAIDAITGHGTLPSAAVKGTSITASFFNQLKTALNAVP